MDVVGVVSYGLSIENGGDFRSDDMRRGAEFCVELLFLC